jgi:alpha-tubulin suppressor-like RCC1 family protein
MAFASENGQCFLHGRHIVNANVDTLYASFGMDHISVASVGLGKTHLVAISKSGLVYTCGLNNLNQCGRTEVNTNLKKTNRFFLVHPTKCSPTIINSPAGNQLGIPILVSILRS